MGKKSKNEGIYVNICESRSNSLNWTCNNWLVQYWERSTTGLYIVTLLILHICRVHHGEGNSTPLQYSCLENPIDGGTWWAVVHRVVKSQTWLHFHFYALEKEMATHSSVLAWRIPGTGEPGGLPSMGSRRVGERLSSSSSKSCFKAVNLQHWRSWLCINHHVI